MADTVLIVDDDEAVLTMLRKVMKSSGIQSDAARSGGEAIEMAGRGHYDLMLLDVNRPGDQTAHYRYQRPQGGL